MPPQRERQVEKTPDWPVRVTSGGYRPPKACQVGMRGVGRGPARARPAA